MGGGEVVGDIAQGALLARAVEPAAGETPEGHTHESACLNCGAPLVGPHCHACGQAAHVHKTLAAFFHDVAHGVFHFEGKIWRTLPLLAWRPGRLTREYIDGRRASYVSPIALFLFVTFLTFAVFNAIGNPIALGDVVKVDGKKQDIATAERDIATRLTRLRSERRAALAAGGSTAVIDGQIDSAERERKVVRAIGSGDLTEVTKSIAATPATGERTGIDALWRKAKQNPELLIYKLQANAYKYSWLLIPISVPFVWLLFAWRRRFGLYDHTVFVTYSLCFMMALLIVASIGAAEGVAALVVIPVLYAPFHLYRQLRETYALGRGGAIVRTVALLAFAAVALVRWGFALVALILG